MLIIETHENREEWLSARGGRLGASDAGACLGINPWKSNVQLWREKTGRTTAPDISDNANVRFGTEAEGPVREIFAAAHPEFVVSNRPFDILYDDEEPWRTATLDGVIVDKATGRKGVYEGKTSQITKAALWAKWDGKVPDYYFAQVMHQLKVTGWDFCYLVALLVNWKGEMSIKEYYFDAKEHEADIQYVAERERDFWECVEKNKQPPLLLPEI